MKRNLLLFAGLLWVVMVGSSGVGGQSSSARPSAASLLPVLAALDRVVPSLEMQNASVREVFTEIGRIGGIRVVLDSAIPSDLRLNVKLKGTRLGDALTVICQSSGLRLLPGEGCLVVTRASVAAAPSSDGRRPPRASSHNPWAGWAEVTGLPLGPAGETGYPRLALPSGVAGPGVGVSVPLTCPRCRAPVLAYWAYCPYCGQQILNQRPVGRFCWGCGRPLDEGHDHTAAPLGSAPQK